MLKRFKQWLRQRRCKHYRTTLKNWCWVYAPAHVLITYQCIRCGKEVCRELYSKEATAWCVAMGNYKQIGGVMKGARGNGKM